MNRIFDKDENVQENAHFMQYGYKCGQDLKESTSLDLFSGFNFPTCNLFHYFLIDTVDFLFGPSNPSTSSELSKSVLEQLVAITAHLSELEVLWS